MNESSRMRISIVGVVVLALFSTLLVRLWFLQVASGKSFAAAVETNTLRRVPIDPVRGRILDAQGAVLADNRIVTAITLDRDVTPAEKRHDLSVLVPLLGLPAATIEKNLADLRVSPLKPAVAARDVSPEATVYVREHEDELPGVHAVQLAEREYPQGGLASQLLGWTGEITGEDLKQPAFEHYKPGDVIGKAGVERSYEWILHGKPGYQEVEVDAAGNRGRVVREVPPVPGMDLKLTIDLGTQTAAEQALQQGMDSVRTMQDKATREKFEKFKAPAGAVVLLDADTGAVVAMASNPGFDPNELARGVLPERFAQLAPKDYSLPQPLENKVIAKPYATGSTFKLFTSLAALQSGLRTPNTWINDHGFVKIGNMVFQNAGRRSNGRVNLSKALTVSSDVYFYEIGGEFWDQYKAALRAAPENTPADAITAGLQLQTTAREFGFGSKTGIALAGEQPGRVPDPAFRVNFNKNNPDASSRIWYPGDNVNFAVGQGDFVATPLQLAEGYATYANGGNRLVPRVAAEALDPLGRHNEIFKPKSLGTVRIEPAWRTAIDAGLHGAVADPAGTAYQAFLGWPFDQIPLEGKTGTAQVQGKQDTSVFVGMATIGGKRYVAASFVEEAGFGSSVSAPIVRRVLEHVAGIPAYVPVQAFPDQGVD